MPVGRWNTLLHFRCCKDESANDKHPTANHCSHTWSSLNTLSVSINGTHLWGDGINPSTAISWKKQGNRKRKETWSYAWAKHNWRYRKQRPHSLITLQLCFRKQMPDIHIRISAKFLNHQVDHIHHRKIPFTSAVDRCVGYFLVPTTCLHQWLVTAILLSRFSSPLNLRMFHNRCAQDTSIAQNLCMVVGWYSLWNETLCKQTMKPLHNHAQNAVVHYQPSRQERVSCPCPRRVLSSEWTLWRSEYWTEPPIGRH